MIYQSLAILFAVLAVVLCFFSLRLLLKGTWLLGFIRGIFGLSLLAAVCGLSLVGWEFYQYRQVNNEQQIASLSITQISEKEFEVEILEPLATKSWKVILKGDQWQMDARIIRWSRTGIGSSLKPGYRLERISGRYYSLEEEQNSPRTVHSLVDQEWNSSVWNFLHSTQLMGLIDARYGSATFVPLADGAIYSIGLSHTGLVAKPVNPAAKKAVERWN